MSEDRTQGGRLRPFPSVVRTREQLEKAVEHLSKYDEFTVDVETNFAHPKINEISWIGFAVPDRVVLIPMGHPKGVLITPSYSEKRLPPEEERKVLKNGKLSEVKKPYTVPATFADPGPQLRQDEVFELLKPLFFSDRTKIGHNVKFDIESISKYYGEIPPGPYVDTIILTHVLDENLDRYGLKDLIMDWLRVPPNPDVRKKFYPNLGKIGVSEQPIDEVAQYLAKDVWYTHLYYRENVRLLNRVPALRETFDIEMGLYPVLMDMELTGIKINVDLLKRRGEELEHDRAATAGRIWSICGEQFPVSNPTMKRKYLFGPKKDGGQGLKPMTFTAKTNTPQLNQATLEHYAKENELAALMLEWSEKDKIIGTFIEGLTEKLVKGRLHTSFNQHRTVTGRLSSMNPNLQQIPRGDIIRDTFIADEGRLLVVADYDQVELRCAAFLSNDAEMVRVFREGLDIHAQAAAAMLDVPLDEVTKDQRQVGKTQNFGTLYGAGPQKIATVANCSMEQAQEFIARYFEQFAGLSAWKDGMILKARKTGRRNDGKMIPYADIPPFGRRRRLPDLYAEEMRDRSRAERQVINSIVQGFAASVMKCALIDLRENIVQSGLPIDILLNVHDEVVVQAPENMIEEAKALVVGTMSAVTYNGDPILGSVPLTADAGIGKSWSEAK
jgi:DNA polymerase I-like protein with 3'-5' exonuclease and polymerase domains